MDGNIEYFKKWLELYENEKNNEKRLVFINKIVNKRYGEDSVRFHIYFVINTNVLRFYSTSFPFCTLLPSIVRLKFVKY